MAFASLPTELAENVFDHLVDENWPLNGEWYSILRLRAVCKLFDYSVTKRAFGQLNLIPEYRRRLLPHMNKASFVRLLQEKCRTRGPRQSIFSQVISETIDCIEQFRAASEPERAPNYLENQFATALMELFSTDTILNMLQGRFIIKASTPDNNALCFAAWSGDVLLAQKLLDCNVDVNQKSALFGLPVVIAAAAGNKSMVGFLLDNAANIEATMECGGLNALFAAVAFHQENVVKLLLGRGAKIFPKAMIKYRSVTHLALVRGGHRGILQELINAGASTREFNSDFETPLIFAIRNNLDESILLTLLQNGADIECRSTDSMTPLHVAISRNHYVAVELLIRFGANLDAKDKDDITPVKLAALANNRPMLQLLHQNGANLNESLPSGTTLYGFVAESFTAASVPVAEYLIANGSKVFPKKPANTKP